jgi:hypothetical protein
MVCNVEELLSLLLLLLLLLLPVVLVPRGVMVRLGFDCTAVTAWVWDVDMEIFDRKLVPLILRRLPRHDPFLSGTES